LRALVQELAAGGKTILLSSHEMAEVELLCPRVVMIHLGRIVLSGAVDAIKQEHSEHAVIVGGRATAGLSSHVLGLGTAEQAGHGTEAPGTANALAAVPGVLRVDPCNGRLKVWLDKGCQPSEFLARAVAAGAAIDHFEIALPSLEEVFVRIVKRET
jgi:ABC-2 type transport system ATP-binding protein